MNRRASVTLILLIAAAMAASPALSQGRRSAALPQTPSLAEIVRGLLPDFLARFMDGAGCGVDPSGIACQPVGLVQASPPPRRAIGAKAGCVFDPLGGVCHSTTTSQTVATPNAGVDIGCGVDPLGGCLRH